MPTWPVDGWPLWAIFKSARRQPREEQHDEGQRHPASQGKHAVYDHPDQPLAEAVNTMADKDIGSLVVMEHGDLVGMLTFREVIVAIVGNGGQVGGTLVRKAMDDHPVTCTLETDLDEIR